MSDPKVIWLEPACIGKQGDREWCQDDVWGGCECGMQSVRYNLAEDFDQVTAERDAALGREAALQKGFAQKVVLSVRDICELEPADSDDPECICINASDLGAILSRHFEGIE